MRRLRDGVASLVFMSFRSWWNNYACYSQCHLLAFAIGRAQTQLYVFVYFAFLAGCVECHFHFSCFAGSNGLAGILRPCAAATGYGRNYSHSTVAGVVEGKFVDYIFAFSALYRAEIVGQFGKFKPYFLARFLGRRRNGRHEHYGYYERKYLFYHRC